MNRYLFVRKNGVIKATVNSTPLVIVNLHSQNGIAWGERSDKSNNLAYSILLSCSNKDTAEFLYEDFASTILAPLLLDEWEMSDEHIQHYIGYRASLAPSSWHKDGGIKTIPLPPHFLGNLNESLALKK